MLYIKILWFCHLILSLYRSINIFKRNVYAFFRTATCIARGSDVLSSVLIRWAWGTAVRCVTAVCLKGRGTETHRRSTPPQTPASAACVRAALLRAARSPVPQFPAITPSSRRDSAAHSAEVSVRVYTCEVSRHTDSRQHVQPCFT